MSASVHMHTIKCTFICFVLELQQIFDSFGYLKLAFDSFRILVFGCDLLFIYMEFILCILKITSILLQVDLYYDYYPD